MAVQFSRSDSVPETDIEKFSLCSMRLIVTETSVLRTGWPGFTQDSMSDFDVQLIEEVFLRLAHESHWEEMIEEYNYRQTTIDDMDF